jgi:hypothetical protein
VRPVVVSEAPLVIALVMPIEDEDENFLIDVFSEPPETLLRCTRLLLIVEISTINYVRVGLRIWLDCEGVGFFDRESHRSTPFLKFSSKLMSVHNVRL